MAENTWVTEVISPPKSVDLWAPTGKLAYGIFTYMNDGPMYGTYAKCIAYIQNIWGNMYGNI